ncbi:MAG TPA: NUDIX domain-containing protein [Roseiflexaceae bacterium]|nr:NUDIX domain-containing protein [Roseiflexaceae bacterium]
MASKAQRHAPSGDDTPIAGVGGVVYRRDADGRIAVLLIRKRDGYWTLPKGKVKPGETEPDALAREVAEETGLTGTVEARVRTVSYLTPRRHPPRRKVVTYYLFRVEDGVPQPGVHEGIADARWTSPRAALQRIRRPRVRRVLRDALLLLRVQPADRVV